VRNIPYARQLIDREDIRAVVRALKSDFLTQGPEIEKFETEFSVFCGAKFAVACSSATAGLHMAAMALNLSPGDRWWTSPNTFCATADAARRCGAEVDFIDIEWGTYNMDLELLEDRLKAASRKNRLPQVVAPVHFAGNPVDMNVLGRLKKKYGFKVVEDAAHATGASFQGEPVGSCRWSDMCVFSFHAVKIITTGEGGMVTTNKFHLNQRLRILRTHGINRVPRLRPSSNQPPWYYEKTELGNHYRMTDFQAALGRSQLKKIWKFRAARKKISEYYGKQLVEMPLDLPRETPGAKSSWHLFPISLKKQNGRDNLMQSFRQKGVLANLHYLAVPSLAYYRKKFFGKNHTCPNANRYTERAISLPIHPSLKKQHLVKIVNILRKEFRKAGEGKK